MYKWLKDGIPVTDYSTGQYYRIQNTRREDAGSYQCVARNDAGTIFSEKIDVIVACKLGDSISSSKIGRWCKCPGNKQPASSCDISSWWVAYKRDDHFDAHRISEIAF